MHVHVADNLYKSLQVVTVVTPFGFDEFLTCCTWELKILNIWSILILILYVNGDYNMECTTDFSSYIGTHNINLLAN
jgi:hypothetical protein